MGRPWHLVNPVALSAVALVPVVRGAGYLIADLAPRWGIAAEVGPTIPALPLWVVGLVWIFLGVFMVSALWKWAWFKTASALAVGAYITWAILYAADLFLSPDIISITALASFVSMVPVIITLTGVELDRDWLREKDVQGDTVILAALPPGGVIVEGEQ